MSSTLKASENPLVFPLSSLVVVGSSRLAFTVTGQMANPFAVGAFRSTGNGYSLKDKNEAKTDKTKHENGKSVKSQNQSQSQSQRSKPRT
ncbi:hypothetical protein Tco_0950712 [Tanacetum coccineum]